MPKLKDNLTIQPMAVHKTNTINNALKKLIDDTHKIFHYPEFTETSISLSSRRLVNINSLKVRKVNA